MSDIHTIADTIQDANNIVIIQADNPDGDSLGSALALEQILHEMGKEPILFCGVDIPSYLRYMPGSDRVIKDFPNSFDVSILVDCATVSLLGQLEKNNQIGALSARPMVIIDHHSDQSNMPFNTIEYIDSSAVATGEVIYYLAKELGWQLNQAAKESLVSSLMADSLGLTSEGTTAKSVFMLAELVEQGVVLAELEARRRLGMVKPLSIIKYKGELLQRIEYFNDDRLAMVVIPWEEIEAHSPLYNPSMLALEELRLAEGVAISVALKTYPDGKITAKIRCNHGYKIADALAGHFGGGGHPYAAGFKTSDWLIDELRTEIITQTAALLDERPADE